MIVLAVEQSSARGSLVVLDKTRVLAKHTWEEDRLRSQRLFSHLQGILDAAKITADQINLFAIGAGPGIFSGLRVSISALRGLALPGQTPVICISSAEAIIAALREETGRDRICVLGDARRQCLWVALSESADQEVTVSTIPTPDLVRLPLQDTLIVTPEWDRIRNILEQTDLKTATLIRESQFPTAEWIGRLALDKHIHHRPLLPLSPIYLHPAV